VPSSLDYERVCESIEVYGFNRSNLVLNRLEVLRLIQGRMFTIACLVTLLNELAYPEDQEITTPLEDLLSHELAELFRFRDLRRPYALMCMQQIDSFIDTLVR